MPPFRFLWRVYEHSFLLAWGLYELFEPGQFDEQVDPLYEPLYWLLEHSELYVYWFDLSTVQFEGIIALVDKCLRHH